MNICHALMLWDLMHFVYHVHRDTSILCLVHAYVLLIMNNMTRIKYVCHIGTLCRVLMLGISCILYGRCIEILPHYDQYRHIPYNIYVPYDIMRVFSLHGIWQCECAQARRGSPTEYSYTNPPGGQCAHSWVMCREVQYIQLCSNRKVKPNPMPQCIYERIDPTILHVIHIPTLTVGLLTEYLLKYSIHMLLLF